MTDHQGIADTNRQAWDQGRYEAWIAAFGTPQAAAATIVADPERVVRRLLPHLGSVSGRRVCSVQGSHGRVAVALALLGAQVQVIDFGRENRDYAMALAAAAGVSIDYALADIMDAERVVGPQRFDAVTLELGILHYHQDLAGFFGVVQRLAAPAARLVLNEFHPVQRKLFWPEGPRDYFAEALVEADVPNPDPLGEPLGKCLYRFWTMGEVVTAVVRAGFILERLDEHPDWSEGTIPGSFTLVATNRS